MQIEVEIVTYRDDIGSWIGEVRDTTTMETLWSTIGRTLEDVEENTLQYVHDMGWDREPLPWEDQ